MNGPPRAWSDAERLRNLVNSLAAQRAPDDGVRGELLASLHRLALGTAVPGDRSVDAIVDLVSDSSLGDCTLDEPDAAVDGGGPTEVAAVLDRLDRTAAHVPAAAVDDDPVQAWSREFRRLLDGHRETERASVLEDAGVDDERRSTLERPSELLTDDGEWLARTMVTGLGHDWADSGFEGLFRAAGRHHAPGSMRTLRMSGLAGADAVDRESARARLEGPLDALPAVRGRDRVVASLVSSVRGRPVRAHVLVGPAGYGKTTVALAAARRLRSAGRMLALCVPAWGLDELVDGLALAAVRTGATLQQLDVALCGDPSQRALQLWGLLDRSRTPWVIVLDGAGEQAVGHPAWTHRSRTGAVLVTTRYGDGGRWGDAARVLRIGQLRPEPGGQIVLDRLGPRPDLAARAAQEQARLLARRLGGVPLALSSAGRLVAATRPGAGALQEIAHELATLSLDNPVTAVYELGVRSGDLRDTVRLLACFAPDRPLPVAVLDGPSLLPELVRTGLVEERLGREHTITIHPGIAELSRRDAVIDAGVVDRRAIALLRRRLQALDPGLFANRPSVRLLEPHVAELVASPALGTGRLLVEALDLADRTASALVRCGHQRLAGTLLDAALERAEGLDRHHPAVLALRHTRARMAALDGGDFATAERELVDVLALRTRVLGPRHHDTLSTRDCLAWVSAERGVPEEARDEIATVLALRTEVLGAEHPDTLATRHRLGWVDVQLGRRAEAVADLAEVLVLRRRALGPEHLDVHSTRYRLAWALVKADRYAEGEEAFRELQDDLEATAGWRHPLTLMVRVRVGWVLLRQRRLDEAEEHLNDVLADQITVLGGDHRRVLRTRHLLATVALRRGTTRAALERFDEVVAARSGLLGADHPDTLDSRSQQAWALLHAGNADAADRAFQAVVADRARVQGPLNTDTLKMRCLVARARLMRGRLAEAQQLLRRLLDDVEGALPPDHPLAFDVRHTLAVVNGLRGRSTTAEQELRALVDDRARVLGVEHRESLAARDYLAWILGRQGRFSEAFEVASSVLAARTRVLGPRQVHTLTSRYRLAWLTLCEGDRRTADGMLDRLLEDLHDTLGAEHPDTLRCRHARARLRLRAGDDATAAELASAVLRDQMRIQGPDAVDTLRAAEEMGLALLGLPGRGAAGATLLDDVMRRRDTLMGPDHPDNVRLRSEMRARS